MIKVDNINDPIMSEEIFGPILPILTIKSLKVGLDMIQKEAKDKILEYRKEIGILEDKLKDRDNTIQLMQENIDQLKQIIQNHKAMAIAGIPEAIVGEDITGRAFAKTTAQKILEDNKEEK